MSVDGIEGLNNQSTDIRVAAAISRYWKQQDYKVTVIAGQGPSGRTCGTACHLRIVGKTRSDYLSRARLIRRPLSDLDADPAEGCVRPVEYRRGSTVSFESTTRATTPTAHRRRRFRI